MYKQKYDTNFGAIWNLISNRNYTKPLLYKSLYLLYYFITITVVLELLFDKTYLILAIISSIIIVINGRKYDDSEQQFIEYLQTHYADNVKEVKEFELIGISTNVDVEYLGQRENIATFTMSYHHYSGGAHGMYSTHFVNVDLDKKAVIRLDDVFTKAQQNKVKALLWEIYQNESRGDNGERQEPFTAKADFYLSDNFYFSQDGIVFVYPLYALGPYAEGEKELRLSLYDDEVADAVRIQYGGSVKSENALEILGEPNIDGALVGGASLVVDEFIGIIKAANQVSA